MTPSAHPAPTPTPTPLTRLLLTGLALLVLSGCTSYGVVKNQPLPPTGPVKSYSIKDSDNWHQMGDVLLILAFSGGGTRAAAMSYGVMEELRDTPIEDTRLLDEVDRISSVSGGSFTAAYYGLHGDGMFDTFDDAFLKRNVQGSLMDTVLNPFNWFSSEGRTERAIGIYEEQVFQGATFADMIQEGRPLIVINASDLGRGVRFSFIQEYFNLLCSDLSTFPVARAVTASSAVPILFNPVVLENYDECGDDKPEWLIEARKRAGDDPEMLMLVNGVSSYYDKDNRKYLHYVDGGITDNLGLRAIYELVELAGGVRAMTRYTLGGKVPRYVMMVSVDASVRTPPEMDQSTEAPGLGASIGAMSDVQLHRYNVETTALLERSLERWQEQISTPERPVQTYFVRLGLDQLTDQPTRYLVNKVPTSFDLTDEQVEGMKKAGRDLLRENPEFQRLLKDMSADSGG